MRGATALLLACCCTVVACTPKETALQRVTRQRAEHEVKPTSVVPRVGGDGSPQVVVDLLVRNTGREPLSSLTVLVTVRDGAGTVRGQARATADTSGLRPGVTGQLTAIAPGLRLEPGDDVVVEVEGQPPDSLIGEFPEYGAAR